MARRRGAHGEPWQTMLYRCDTLLKRLRQTKPFPVDTNEFMVTVLPMGVLSLRQQELVWENLKRAIHMGNLLHFELEGKDPSYAFWIRVQEETPVPKDMGQLFVVGMNNPFRSAIESWVEDAFEVHNEIDTAHDQLAAFFKSVRHPRWVEREWPEILPYVGSFPKHMLDNAEPPAKAIYKIIPRIRSDIETLLTKCSLLTDAETTAWVAYEGGSS